MKTRNEIEKRITEAFEGFQKGKSREAMITLLANDIESELKSNSTKLAEIELLKFTTSPIGSEHSYARGLQVGTNETVDKILEILK